MNGSGLSSLGKTTNWNTRSAKATIPTKINVALQPTYRPTTLPKGSPKIIAMEEPVTIILIAKSLCSSSTSFTAMTEAIDQNTACALATTILASTNNTNEVAMPLSICPKANTDNVINRTGLNEYFEIDIMSGNDKIMTDHEYTVIMMPAVDSEIENALAIDVNKPIGINSDVLNINAASAIPMSGNRQYEMTSQ